LLARKQVWSDSTNTIVVPNNENWIIQGALGPDGLSVKLDARLSSGSAIDFSEASIVVRHVRFSGQTAPQDEYRSARDYGWIDDPFGGGTTLGGAFSYDGGGLEPGIQTPRLIFEHVVFDHNGAVGGSAVWIAGRQGTWSGIKLVVDGCLFFRNVAIFHSAIAMWNLCPSTLLVNNTDFIHNEAFVIPHLWIQDVDTKVGVAGQSHTVTVANSHFEGPMWTYSTAGPVFCLHLTYTRDGANYDSLMERVTQIDAQSDNCPGALACCSSGARPINCRIRECRVARVTGTDSGLGNPPNNRAHSTVILLVGTNYSAISHLALEDSGAFQDETRGEGVLLFEDEIVMLPEYESTNEYHVLDSTFARNKAARGAAIGWFSSKAQLVVQRCWFEVSYGPRLRSVHGFMHMLVLYVHQTVA
jgi:hypothetical protein